MMKVSAKVVEKLKEDYDHELVDAAISDFETGWEEFNNPVDQASFNWFFDIYFTATLSSLSMTSAVGKLVNVNIVQ
jgi:hypothetical protein